jgi:hypothetical protein
VNRWQSGALAMMSLIACSKDQPTSAAASATAPPPTMSAPSAPVTPSATSGPSSIDVAHQGYGTGIPGTAPIHYRPYANGRFAFSVEYPDLFAADPPPENGDGLSWRWGDRAKMSAWGMNNVAGGSASEVCDETATEKAGLMGKQFSNDTCFVTGKTSGKIYWEKVKIGPDTLRGLTLEYDEDLKTFFDPIVEHVNATFRTP